MLAADAKPQEPGREVILAGNGGSAFDGRLDAAQAGCVADDPNGSADGVGTIGASEDVEGHNGAEARHEAARGLVGRMIETARVAHELYLGKLSEAISQLCG